MGTFRELLESHLNEKNIIQDEKFIKNIEGWVEKNEQKFAKYIGKVSSGIPAMFKKKDKFFRGLIISNDDFDKIQSGGSITLSNISSWTTDIKIAERFINDPKYRVHNGKDGVKLILEKKLEPIIDIYNFVLYAYNSDLLTDFDPLALDSALKEKEVLVNKNIKITKNDIKKIIK